MAVAQAVRRQLDLDEVIFVPAARNPLKRAPTFASARDRLEMVRLAVELEPGLSVSDIEISRGGLSYAVDTLRELHKARKGRYWFVLGSDTLLDLPRWKQPEALVRLCRLAAVERGGRTPEQILSRLPAEFRYAIDVVPMTPSRFSSSTIREALLRFYEPTPGLPAAVWNYIKESDLYQDQSVDPLLGKS